MNSPGEWSCVVSNVLIVESKNDELFVRALVEHLNLTNVQVDRRPVCHIDDYQCLDGLDLEKLIFRLEAFKNSLPKKDIRAVGVILDHDGKKEERIGMINAAIKAVFDSEEQIKDTNQFIDISTEFGPEIYRLSISCFLTNVDGKGELETLLKAIKTKPSIYADCLGEWRKCIESRYKAKTKKEKKKLLSDKEFDKLWVNNYIRFDTCSSKEKKQAFRKCSMYNFNYLLENKKDILDFEHPALDSFKSFLTSFPKYEHA